jgi:predicted RNA binding protein YcfA (HicA-like mRNA interferase family)
MPKLPSVSSQQIARALERAGFILDRTSGSHRIYYNPVTGKKAIVPIHKLLKEAGIDRDKFDDLL